MCDRASSAKLSDSLAVFGFGRKLSMGNAAAFHESNRVTAVSIPKRRRRFWPGLFLVLATAVPARRVPLARRLQLGFELLDALRQPFDLVLQLLPRHERR